MDSLAIVDTPAFDGGTARARDAGNEFTDATFTIERCAWPNEAPATHLPGDHPAAGHLDGQKDRDRAD